MSTGALVDNIIEILSNRRGFDWWWMNITQEDQEEILKEIEELINEEKP